MKTLDVAGFGYKLSMVAAIEAAYTAYRKQGLGGSHQSIEARKEAIKAVSELGGLFHNNELMECAKYSGSCVFQLSKSIVDVSTIASCLIHFREQVLEDLKSRKFLQISQDRSDYVDMDHLFGENVSRSFPSASADVQMAGNCLSAECCTACVFHLMRAAEHAIRALAHDRGVTIPRGPIELATWEDMLRELEKAETAIQQYPRTLAREEQFKFYHGAMMELRAFKNMFRNSVMHTRDAYDRHQAKSALDHVGSFMRILSARISESTRTPTIWV